MPAMKLKHGLHLAYSTNIHRGEDWAQTFGGLQQHTMAVRERVCPRDQPYAIGLRLSEVAARELSDPAALHSFRHWLDAQNAYVFTINGFPYGRFHGSRVKEQVYVPDWTSSERLLYTNRLFDLLAVLLPEGCEGSISTAPCSFKEFIRSEEQVTAMRANLWSCVEHIHRVSEASGKVLHLGLEPEPLCYLETSAETVAFFEQMRRDRPSDDRVNRYLGVNYDACHLAVEFEEPEAALGTLREHQIRISKLHFSSALKVRPTPPVLKALRAFEEGVSLHQVVARSGSGPLRRYRDLDVALSAAQETPPGEGEEWRIHFHIPLHCRPEALFDTTTDHLLGVMDILQRDPSLCSHLEMETYTWEVMPEALKNRSVVDQLVAEYTWCLEALGARGLV
jgi:hypothetical protein